MTRDAAISRVWRLLLVSLASAVPMAAQAPTFAELHRMLPLKERTSYSLATVDLNNDGHQDLFVAGDEQDRLYLNDGTAHFTDVTSSLPVEAHDTWSVAAGDVDGDGDADLLLALGGWYAPRLLLNDGAGTFATFVGHIPPTTIDFVTFGDLDGDGDLDAMGCYATGSSVFVYLNDGAGFFTDATGTNLPPSLPAGGKVIALGDVDGDGDLDAFWGRGGQNRLFLNTGTGSFVDATSQLPAIADTTFDVALTDLDADGDLDAVVGNRSAGPGSLTIPSYLLFNSGAGVFSGPFFLPGVLQNVNAVAAFDIDLDADVDVLVAGNGAQVYLTAPGPVAPIAIDSVGALGRCLAGADFDGDGDRDVVIGAQLFLNAQGAGLAQIRPVNGPSSSGVVSVATGDVDGDGDRDVVTNGGVSPRLYHNDGSGVFTDVTAQTVFSNSSTWSNLVNLADLDGDGDLDCFADTLYLNNGIGVFIDAGVLLPPNTPEVRAIADVDGDGDLDAYSGQYNLLLNDGAAGFSYAATSLPQVAIDDHSPAAFGDFDGDGDQDLLILASNCGGWGQMALFLNTGSGVFVDATANLPPYTWGVSSAVALGDVDGDGDLDAVITDVCVAPAALLVNNGSGVFTAVPTAIDGGYGVALRDIDQDGDLDAVSGWLAGLWLNDGTGTFSDASNLLPPQRTVLNDVAVEDFDGDGDVDFFVGTTHWSGCQLLSNLTRQLSWRAPPRAGKPLWIDVAGPPNGAYLLIADTITTTIPVQPFGILRLDPVTSPIVGSGTLDQQGRAALSFAVPLSAPIGFTVYAQAAVAWPIHVTNLEVFVVTGF